jgi:hypothetical protein
MAAKLKLILIILIVPILSVVLVTAHARLRDAGPVKGRVIEAGTGRPIDGAFVVAKWTYYFWHTNCFHVQIAETNANGEFRIPRQIRYVALSGKPNVGRFVVAVYKRGYRDIDSSGMLISVDSEFVVYRPPDPSVTPITIDELGLEQERYEYPASPSEEWKGIRTKTALRSPLPAWWKFGSDWQYLVADTSAPEQRLKHLKNLSHWASCYGAGQQNRNLVPFQEALYEEARAIASSAAERKIARSLCEELAYVATREDGHPAGSETDTLKAAYLRARRPECLTGKLAPEPAGGWLRGEIQGLAFRPDRVELKLGRLAFIQSKDRASDIALQIPVPWVAGGKMAGSAFHIGENGASSQTLYLRWTDPASGRRKDEFIREGYTLDLEFGQEQDYEILGKISLHMPPYAYLSGAFTASTSDLHIVDGEVDLTQDNHDTVYYVAERLIKEAYRTEEVETERRSSTLSATGRALDPGDPEHIYASGELKFAYRVGDAAPQEAEFHLVRDRNGWRVERVIKPENFPELQKREDPS